VLEAASGEEALRVARGADRVDLLLPDVVLPGMSGREVARLLASEIADLATLLMAGYAPAADGEGDVGSFLRKPFEPERLLATVRERLDRRPGPPRSPRA
jgi:CheY-like chemotaxis protein